MKNTYYKEHTAIFGGSFNPPTFGHQAVCLWLLEALEVDKIIMVPTFDHMFGKKLEDFDHRMAMCNLAADAFGWRVRVSKMEASMPKPNSTVKLLEYYKEINEGNLILAIGSDVVKDLEKWAEWQRLPELATVVVIPRDAEAKTIKAPFDVITCPIVLPSASSTEIRENIVAGKEISGMVPKSVEEYIQKHNLYLS